VAAANTGSGRILLVDDEQSVQTLLTYPLRKEGYEVVPAHDGREALDRFAEQRFDLVVLDIMLPKLDGIEVCRRMRSRSQVPIIMLTAKDDEIDKVLGLEMGADDYITKPFSVREFRSRVRAALRRAEMIGSRPGGEEPIAAGGLEVRFEGGGGAARRRGAHRGGRAEDRFRAARGDDPAKAGRAHLRGVRDPRRAGAISGASADAGDAPRAGLGRFRLPRSADRGRPHPPSPREARAGSAIPGIPLHRARRRIPLPGQGRVSPDGKRAKN